MVLLSGGHVKSFPRETVESRPVSRIFGWSMTLANRSRARPTRSRRPRRRAPDHILGAARSWSRQEPGLYRVFIRVTDTSETIVFDTDPRRSSAAVQSDLMRVCLTSGCPRLVGDRAPAAAAAPNARGRWIGPEELALSVATGPNTKPSRGCGRRPSTPASSSSAGAAASRSRAPCILATTTTTAASPADPSTQRAISARPADPHIDRLPADARSAGTV